MTLFPRSRAADRGRAGLLIPAVFAALLMFSQDTTPPRLLYESFLNDYYLRVPRLPERDGHTALDHPELAAFQDYIMTMDPATGTVPSYRLLPAYQKSRSMGNEGKGRLFQWEEQHANTGGRTRALMFDPNDPNGKKVWAGAVTGGLWYTTDITSWYTYWQPVNDFWDNLVISSIVSDPKDPEIFYVGTGEPQTAVTIYRESSGVGIGIWKSEDGGVTWELLPSTTGFSYVTDMVVRLENDTSVIYAGVVSGIYKGKEHTSLPSDGLYRSSDGGDSWEQVLPNIPGKGNPFAVSDLILGNDGRIYAGTMRNLEGHGAASILWSDDGRTWYINDDYLEEISQLSDPLINIPGRVMLTVSPSHPNFVYAVVASGGYTSAGFIYYKAYCIIRSEDRGLTWHKVNMPLAEGRNWAYLAWHALVIETDPYDPNTLYAGGLDLHKSTDGGNSWRQITNWLVLVGETDSLSYMHPDLHRIVFQPGSSDLFLVGTDGGVFLTRDGMQPIPRFDEVNQGFNTIQYYTCAIHPEAGQPYYLAGTQDNGTFRYLGPAITRYDMISYGDGAYCFIDEDQPEINITSVYYNRYYVFTNRAGNELSAPNEIDYYTSGIFINPADYDSRLNILYANAMTFDGQAKDRLLRIRKMTSDVPVGEFLPLNTASKVPYSHVRVSPWSPPNSTTLYIGTQSGRLFRVGNAQNIPVVQEIGGLKFPTGNISCIDVGPDENNLLVTFSNFGVPSVWRTTTGGGTWTNVEGDLPDMPVRWCLYHPDNPRIAILATELGVWTTGNLDDNVVTWVPDNKGLANVRVDMLRLRKSDNTLIAATHGRGLFLHSGLGVGIDEVNPTRHLPDVRIYPNPSSGIFRIEVDPPEPFSLQVIDLSGRTVYPERFHRKNTEGHMEIDLTGFPPGIYILHGKSASGHFSRQILLL